MQLNRMHGLDAASEAALRGAICSVSGVSVVSMKVTQPTGANTMRLAFLDVRVGGWSPSLHAIEMTWRCTMRARPDTRSLADQLLANFAQNIAEQRRRCGQGIALDVALPFGAMADNQLAADHMTMDRGLADMIRRSGRLGSASLTRHVGRKLYDMHRTESDGSTTLAHQDAWLDGTTFSQHMPLGDDADYHGDRLWLRSGDMPETITIAAPGRRLGEIVQVPECIANHVVTSIEPAEDGGTDIWVKPVMMTIRDIEVAWTTELVQG